VVKDGFLLHGANRKSKKTIFLSVCHHVHVFVDTGTAESRYKLENSNKSLETLKSLCQPYVVISFQVTNTTAIDYESENLVAERWRIKQDSVSYFGLTFEITYNVSDYIVPNLVTYSIYDGPGCSASANPITDLGYFNCSVNL